MKRSTTYHWLTAVLVLTGLAASVCAQVQPQEIETTVGNGTIVMIPGPIDRIALVDDSIARINIISKQELLVQGLRIGQTSLIAWHNGSERIHYLLRVGRDLSLLRSALAELDPGISVAESPNGKSILLLGDIPDAATAAKAEAAAAKVVAAIGKTALLNMLSYPDGTEAETDGEAADARLRTALIAVDARIRVRRIQVGDASDAKADSFILEGAVSSVSDLVRAVTIADLQLGGSGGIVQARDKSQITSGRLSGIGSSGAGGLQGMSAGGPPPSGLAAQLSRGLIVGSESGRVISFLEVDQIQQVLVSIRVLEIDRTKARATGINYRIDGDSFSIGSYNGPQALTAGSVRGTPNVSGAGGANLVGAYVSDSIGILAAVDFLQANAVARSVAEPNVLTLTGESAAVTVGGEVPIPTTSIGEVAAVQGYFFQTFGVQLQIRPTVTEDDIVTLEVAPSIVRPSQGLAVEGVPGFEVQSVRTTARVPADESLVLGGLLTYRETMSERKVPFFGSIPLIGALFRWDSTTREERELLFVITPRILDDAPNYDEVAALPELEAGHADLRDPDSMPQRLLDNGIPASWSIIEPAKEWEDEPTDAVHEAIPLDASEKEAPAAPAAAVESKPDSEYDFSQEPGIEPIPENIDELIKATRAKSSRLTPRGRPSNWTVDRLKSWLRQTMASS